MNSAKEMWIAEYDELVNEALDAGKSQKAAEAYAEARIDGRFKDKIADIADMERLRRKDGA